MVATTREPLPCRIVYPMGGDSCHARFHGRGSSDRAVEFKMHSPFPLTLVYALEEKRMQKKERHSNERKRDLEKGRKRERGERESGKERKRDNTRKK